MEYKKVLGIVLIILGVAFVVNYKVNILGAVIGTNILFNKLSTIIGLVFIFGGIGILVWKGRHKNTFSFPDLEEILDNVDFNPEKRIIIDTPFIFDIRKRGINLHELFSAWEANVQIPKSVYDELKGDNELRKELKPYVIET